MADETQTPDINATPPVEPAAPPAAGATTLSIEQVQAMIAEAAQKAHDSAYAKARRDYEARLPKAPKPETPPATKTSDSDALAIMDMRDRFEEALGDIVLSAKQKRFLRDRVDKERPDDVATFVSDAIEVMGIKPPATNPASTTNSTTPQQPKPTIPATPAPAATPEAPNAPAFRAMSEEAARDMWQAYVRRKGAVPGNPYDPRNRAVWRELRRQFDAEASIASIQLGARRG